MFAPSWALLGPALKLRDSGGLTAADWERYREGYRAEMLDSYKRNRPVWDGLLQRSAVTLCCYCATAECHRVLLAGFLVRLGAIYAGERKPAQMGLNLQGLGTGMQTLPR